MVIKTILQDDLTKCRVCGSYTWLEYHHVFGGANRKKSDKDGLIVRLCHFCHNEPPYGVHFNKLNRLNLQEEAQIKWQEHYKKSSQDFMKKYGKNYIRKEENE